MTTGAAMFGGAAIAQNCDRCAGLVSPACGCESPTGATVGPKQCNCKCIPKPSIGEKLLAHLDKLGDRLESNARSQRATGMCRCDQPSALRTGGDPSCGCEGKEPSCGLEFSSAAIAHGSGHSPFVPSQVPIVQVPMVRPYSNHATPFGQGGPIEGTNSSPPIPKGMASPSDTVPPSSPSTSIPKNSLPEIIKPEPPVQRVPFEQRKPAQEQHRIPAVEPTVPRQSPPNTLKPTPMDPPPALIPKSNPPKANPIPNNDSSMPDVLVDPFKDDASFRGTKQNSQGIVLTTGRRSASAAIKNSPMPLTLSKPSIDRFNEPEAAPTFDMPASLTPTQKHSAIPSRDSGLQFEASAPALGEQPAVISSSHVVASNYVEAVPVKVTRKVPTNLEIRDASQGPHVPRTKVPQKR